MKKPELVAPGGNLEKLKIAILNGADAVYVGGHVFGLRKYADNFSAGELAHGVQFARDHGKKVFFVLNGFARDEDIDPIRRQLEILEAIQPHALIISDVGVFSEARSFSIPIHVSTQASVTHWRTAELWRQWGAKRIVLARELSLAEIKAIKDKVDIEIEVFVHGASCASYSGKCVISNYTSGRDSNRGGCVQSCRHQFDVMTADGEQQDFSAHIMNAKDLNTIDQLPAMIAARIDGFKIEGRMKSNLYVKNAVQVYRQAIDLAFDSRRHDQFSATIPQWQQQLSQASHRDFGPGLLEGKDQRAQIQYDFKGYQKSADFIGTVKAVQKDHQFYVQVKAPFCEGDTLILRQIGQQQPFQVRSIRTVGGNKLRKSNPNSVVCLPWISGVQPYDILVKDT